MSAAEHSPLHQFEIHTISPMPTLFGYNIDFTNASLYMLLAVVATVLFMYFGIRRGSLVPGRWQSMVEVSYEFVSNIVKENIGSKGRAFFPFIFTLFMFLIMCNLLGMIPGSFTVTSHIAVTFSLAIAIFIGATLVGFMKHGFHFLSLFVPQGVPVFLAVLLVPIELMSYLARPITLSLRLAGNMMAGHVLLKVIGGFVGMLGVFGVVPLLLLTVFVGFEFLVAVLQAYIFALLTCVYLNDAVNMH